MRRVIYVLVFVSWHCYGQSNEFPIYSNGLIYDESTMSKLAVIVDSLNLKFRTCDLSHPYYSFPQGIAHVVELPTSAVRKAIHEGISFEEFAAKYPMRIKQRDYWIVKTSYETYDGKRFIRYGGLPSKESVSVSVKDKKGNHKLKGWVLADKGDIAFYIEGLQPREIPYGYARLVQYVDCMIDTTSEIYLPEAKASLYPEVDETTIAHRFLSWAENFPGKPVYPNYEKIEDKDADSVYEVFSKRLRTWDSLRLVSLDRTMKTSPYWEKQLEEAAQEALDSGKSDERLEFYISRYLSKELALRLKRSRRVVGFCSMDQSPRYHAMNICRLAAETTKWDIFLRSHLDIMNDRFERQSDGSYAWAGRKTYLKELESLDIPAVDLLIGTSLRVSNVSDNHYTSSIGRTGRALADASDKDVLEARLVAMISDEDLDLYNRLLMAYLFSHYVHNLDDETRQKIGVEKLKAAVGTLPGYAKSSWAAE